MLRFNWRRRLAASAVVVGALGVPAGAAAYEGEFAKFNYCPVSTSGVASCLDSVTNSGTIVLGSKKTPIVNPVTLQGGFSEENEETTFSTFYGATNGETLSKTPQPVPGGLAGIVPPESAPPLVKEALAFFFENGLTGVNATLELAEPASAITLSKYNLLLGSGTALELPVKVHLENPFLGSSCYVGSNSAPIIWHLTTGTTSPPSPYAPITGKQGYPEAKENYELGVITKNEMVDNDWAAPKAKGCGGLLSLLVDPVIDAASGLPAAAGVNSAVLENTISTAAVESVTDH